MDLVSIGTAYSSLQLIRDSFTLALNAKIDEQTRSKIHAAMEQITKLQDSLFAAQQQLFQLQQENQDLRRQLESSEGWSNRAAQYKLVHTPGSATVYEFQGEPSHYACPACFEQQRVSILQNSGSVYSGAWPCKVCNQSYEVSVAQPIRPAIAYDPYG